MAKFDHCDHRPNLQWEAVERGHTQTIDTCKGIEPPPMEATEPMKQGIGDTAHISPPDIAISLPDISPRGHARTIEPCKE